MSMVSGFICVLLGTCIAQLFIIHKKIDTIMEHMSIQKLATKTEEPQ